MPLDQRKMRDFIALLGGATAWPLAARAQQSAVPVIGFLHPTSAEALPDRLRGFRQGLKEAGRLEGENVIIRYRFADNRTELLPVLANELVRSQVSVIAAANSPAAVAAQSATTMIPIIFIIPEDPVGLGLVTSLARPTANLSGVNLVSGELTAKRLELLRELVPRATRVGVLVNPANVANTDTTLRDVETAARATSMQVQVLKARNPGEIDEVFATLRHHQIDALFVGGDPFFTSRRVQLAILAAHYSRHG